MHLIRRAAVRAASNSTPFTSKSRSIATSSSFLLRSKVQATGISPSVFRRFNSDDAAPQSSDGHAATSGRDYQPREERSSYNDRGGERRPYNDRGGERRPYNDRGGYGGGRGVLADRARGPPPVLVPTSDIYIGNLLFDITAADLEREFAPFGDIKSAVIATDPRGLSKGFGYVQFGDIESATKAIEAKNQQTYEGRRIVVNYVNKTKREERVNPPSKTLFIGNLAFEMSDSDLNKLFRDIRNVIDVRVAIDRRTGQPRGFAHADFVDIESAVKARDALMGQEVYGRALRVDFSLGTRPTREPSNASSEGSSF